MVVRWSRTTTLTDFAWLALAAYGVHMLEEYQLNWRDWARAVIGLPVEWSDCHVTNAVVVVPGIVQAELAPRVPLAPLGFAALMASPVVLLKVRSHPLFRQDR
ncbi:hypothetical protein V5F53_00140 [Xanthobacter sp. V4C-4]|uniref:hypothetical protein n=1 Tax=Xanthobacter cornucopiae TaxID=3119924 RepID=UPI00372BE525